MANVRAPATAKQIVTVGIVPGAIVSPNPIAIPAYFPDLDLTEPNPILCILHQDHSVGALVWTAYTPDTYNAGLAPGQFDIQDSRKIRLGDSPNVDSVLYITYKAAGNIKQD